MSTYRLLLNCTRAEAGILSGDRRFYAFMHRLSDDKLTIQYVEPSVRRQVARVRRHFAESLCRDWMPGDVRAALLCRARTGPAVDGRNFPPVSAILSHILVPHRVYPDAPIVWCSQGLASPSYYAHAGGGPRRWEDVVEMYKRLGAHASRLLIWTESGASRLIAAVPELRGRTTVFPPPVPDPGLVLAKPSTIDGVTRFLFVGVDGERKGLQATLDAFAVVRGDHRAVLTVVSGSRVSHSMGAFPVHIAGIASPERVEELMREADVFISPTHADTYSLAVVEAMAAGCAIVTSTEDPMPEVAPMGIAGMLVPAGEVEPLAEVMQGLLDDPNEVRRLQAGSRAAYMKRNSEPVVRDALCDVLADLSG